MIKELSVVGKRLPRVDAPKHVTGETKFAADMKLPGMLIGKILRSPYARARIVNIDVSKAEELPGVKAAITFRDVPKIPIMFPYFLPDQYILDEKVRFVGEPVAAVAAVSEDVAEEALESIEVEYEVLPAVFDPEEAMKPNVVQIHPEVREIERNILKYSALSHGNLEKGFREADYIFEDRYTTSRVQHCALETHVCVCSFDSTGKLTVWEPTQLPFELQSALAQTLGMPSSKVRVVVTPVGGGFGSKEGMIVSGICALLARKAGRSVKLEFSREEEFYATLTRHPAIIELKTGVKRDGTLTARQAKLIYDTGAYASAGSSVMSYAGSIFVSLYHCPNVRWDGYAVYTNTPVAGAFRGFGNPQISFAVESQMDTIAEKLGMNPKELRLENHVQSGDTTASGMVITSCGLRECIEEGARRIGWERRQKKPGEAGDKKKRGIGMACMMHCSGWAVGVSDSASIILKLNRDGTVNMLTGACELGQGVSTILAQIVAEELGVRYEDVHVSVVDTNIIPENRGTFASRLTFVQGNVAKIAAADAKRQLLDVASKMLQTSIDDLEIHDRRIYVKGAPDKGMFISEAMARFAGESGGAIISRASYDTPHTTSLDPKSFYGNFSPTYLFAAHFVEVEVDTESGKVKVLRMVAAHDVGRAINPTAVEGQIEGALQTGLGYALTEELLLSRSGKPLNPNFSNYKTFTAMDMPKIEVVLVESIDPDGPFGAKGAGEPGLVPTAPAIANAIYNATGIRIKDLPITPEKVLKALYMRVPGSKHPHTS